MPRLIILNGPRAGQRFELPPGIVTLGRQAGNTIVIADGGLYTLGAFSTLVLISEP